MYSSIIFVFMFTISLTTSTSPSSNQNGWYCYNSNGYSPYKCLKAFCGTKQNHDNAQSSCLSEGGTLLEIYSPNDNTAAINAIVLNVSCAKTTDYWFGAVASYGLCYWYPTTQCRADYLYKDWASSYPTNDNDCAIFNTDKSNNTNWTNQPCSQTKFYVCQKLYSSKTECNLNVSSNCILRDNVTIPDVYIANLNLTPYIVIKNTRLTNFTSISCLFDNVTIINSTLEDMVLRNTSMEDVYINNQTSNGVSVTGSAFKRSSFLKCVHNNFVLKNSDIEDLDATQFNTYNSQHINLIIDNGTQIRNFTIINETLNGLIIANSKYNDVHYENFNTKGGRIIGSSFTRNNFENIVRNNLNLTQANFTDVSLSDSNLNNHNTIALTLMQLDANNFNLDNAVFDNFEADNVDVSDIDLSRANLDACFSNVINVYQKIWFFFFGAYHTLTITQPMFDKILLLCNYF